MNFQYIYTLAEYKAVHRARNRAKGQYTMREVLYWLLVIVNICIGIWAIWIKITYSLDFEYWQILSFGVAALMLLFRFVISPFYVRWNLRQQLLENEPVKVEVDEDGLQVDTSKSEMRVKWDGIIRFSEEPEHFILWLNKIQAFSFPKAALGDTVGINGFREMVRRHIGDKK